MIEQLTDAERSALAREVGPAAAAIMQADAPSKPPIGILPIEKQSGAQRKAAIRIVNTPWKPHPRVQRGRQSK